MRNILTNRLKIALGILLLGTTLKTFAQPVVSSSNKAPGVGLSAPVYFGFISSAPDSAGANHTWDFSKIKAIKYFTASIVSESSTPYYKSYPDANYTTKIVDTNGNAMFNYERITSSKYETIAQNVTSNSSTAIIYTNYETRLPFPFHYTDQVKDTFQKSGGSANVAVMTYDAYGTIITPFATYKNVVRVKRYWGVNDYAYDWWTLSPLITVASYSSTSQTMVFVGSLKTAIDEARGQTSAIKVFPNPSNGAISFHIEGNSSETNEKLCIYNMLGKELKQVSVNHTDITFEDKTFDPGIYIYKLHSPNGNITTGKFIIR